MRKYFALLLALCLLFLLSACDKYEGEITWEVAYDGSSPYTTFQFANFCGTATVEIERENAGEGQFYYWVHLFGGSMSCSYRNRVLGGLQPLFTADAGAVIDSYGGYVEKNGAIPITFTAEKPVSGTIILSFAPYYSELPQNPTEPIEGVGVYCWKYEDIWYCGAFPGADQPKSSNDLLDLLLVHNAASLEKMRYLLESRGLMDCTTVYYIDFSCTGGHIKDPEKYSDDYAYLRSAFGIN